VVFIQKEIIIVAKIIYLFIFQQDVLQSHISCSFLLVKIFGYLAFWQVSFFVVAKVKVMCKNVCQVGGVVFFQPVSLQVQPHPTKRAPDAGDSGAIPSLFLRLSIFPVGQRSAAHPSAGNANR
jgi:hypothetical protein